MTKASGWCFALIAIIAGVLAVGYAPTFSWYFVSEDFFTLRALDSGGLWSTLEAHLTGPWLGLEAVRFYRPFSTSLLHAKYLLWGSDPSGYMYTHFAAHLLNVFLVYQIAKRLFRDDRIAAFGVAAIFAVYPYHLNAISFVGAYAIWICTTFWLVGVILYQQSIERGSKLCWRYWGSAGMLILALGSYEQAVIVPGVFVCLDLLRNARDGSGVGWNEIKRWAPLGAALGCYMVVRLSALGAFVGGYSDFPSKLSALGIVELVRTVFAGLVRLAVPTGAPAVALWVVILAAAGLATVTILKIKAFRRDRQAVVWLFGLAWIVLSQVPYLLTTVVPGVDGPRAVYHFVVLDLKQGALRLSSSAIATTALSLSRLQGINGFGAAIVRERLPGMIARAPILPGTTFSHSLDYRPLLPSHHFHLLQRPERPRPSLRSQHRLSRRLRACCFLQANNASGQRSLRP